jgi:cyanophycin synthetase
MPMTMPVEAFERHGKGGRHKFNPISIVSYSSLLGSNAFHASSVARLHLDLGSLAASTDFASECFAAAFRQRFASLPYLVSKPERTEFFCDRLAAKVDPPSLSEVVLEAIVAVENAASAIMHRLDRVAYAAVVAAGEDGAGSELIWSSPAPALARRCAEAAISGLNEDLRRELASTAQPTRGGHDQEYARRMHEIERIARSRRLTTTVWVIREAAKARGIPCTYIGRSYLRLDQGKYQTYFRGSITGRTSHTASHISLDKRLAGRILRLHRLPAPRQVRVANASDALKAVATFGFPVAVKPERSNGGSGVSIVQSPDELERAFDLAKAVAQLVAVEEFVAGASYRLLVIAGRLVAALRIAVPEITGDGERDIAALIEDLNRDPLRDGFRHIPVEQNDVLTRHLERSGLRMSSVLEAGRTIAIGDVPNISRGGYAIDVTDEVHPYNAETAVRAARAIGLDVAGLDFVTPDISRSYKDVGGAIIEINSRPSLGMHFWPRYGKSRDVGGAVLDLMFPEGSRAALASAAIIGDRRTAVVARDVDALLRDAGRAVGLAIKGRAFVDGVRRDLKRRSATRSLRALVLAPEVDTMVWTMSPAAILEGGLIADRVEVAALVAPSPETDMRLYEQALEIVLRAGPSSAVINDDNPFADRVAQVVGSDRVTLISRGGLTRQVKRHLRSGGHAVIARWVEGQRLLELYDGEQLVASLPATGTPLAVAGAANDHVAAAGSTGPRSQRVETRLFALALAMALGQSIDQLVTSLARSPLLTVRRCARSR